MDYLISTYNLQQFNKCFELLKIDYIDYRDMQVGEGFWRENSGVEPIQKHPDTIHFAIPVTLFVLDGVIKWCNDCNHCLKVGFSYRCKNNLKLRTKIENSKFISANNFLRIKKLNRICKEI